MVSKNTNSEGGGNAERTVQNTIRIIRLLKSETDDQHPINQMMLMKRLAKINKAYGTDAFRKTLRKTLHYIHDELNASSLEDYSDSPPQLVFASDSKGRRETQIGDIYWRQEWSDAELSRLVESIQLSRTLSQEEVDCLVEKVSLLGNTHFRKRKEFKTVSTNCIYDGLERVNVLDNVRALQEAITQRVQVDFHLNVYNAEKKLVHVRDKKYQVSPLRIFTHNGRYYLVGVTGNYENISHYRIDLMSDIKATPKKINVPEAERIMAQSKDYAATHANMYYSEGGKTTIWLKVRKDSYTAVADFFGSKYELFQEGKDSEFDTIKVESESPKSVVDWAMQYGGDVVIDGPQKVRKMAEENLREMVKMYGMKLVEKDGEER